MIDNRIAIEQASNEKNEYEMIQDLSYSAFLFFENQDITVKMISLCKFIKLSDMISVALASENIESIEDMDKANETAITLDEYTNRNKILMTNTIKMLLVDKYNLDDDTVPQVLSEVLNMVIDNSDISIEDVNKYINDKFKLEL